MSSTSTFTHAGLKNTGAQSEGLAITGTKTYDAFGYAGNFGYQKTDAGLKLLGHRYYDPETARFLSRDPIKDGRNWYGYGAGLEEPLTTGDPTGLARFQIIPQAITRLGQILHGAGQGISQGVQRLGDRIAPAVQRVGYQIQKWLFERNVLKYPPNGGGVPGTE